MKTVDKNDIDALLVVCCLPSDAGDRTDTNFTTTRMK